MSFQQNLKKQFNSFVRNYIDLTDRDVRRREELNPHYNTTTNRNPESKVLLGIIYDKHQYHKFFVSAALEIKISFYFIFKNFIKTICK